MTKEISKALRFGLDDFEPNQNKTNRERIIEEFNDLFSVAKMLVDDGTFEDSKMIPIESIENKKKKVEKYLLISKELGWLE